VLPRGLTSAIDPGVVVPSVAAVSLLVLATVLWFATGVEASELVRYLSYEIGFVAVPGILVTSLVLERTWELRTFVLGWIIGYLLEVVAYLLCATAGVRSWFALYPAVVGVPALLLHVRAHRPAPRTPDQRSDPSFRTAVLTCAPAAGLLLSTAASFFSQFPLPRSAGAVTYQEDTPFTISLASEVLHHWPVTLPQVAGEPLHYHLAVYLHLAAISSVTGIDLSVIAMRLYLLPLLALLTLMIVLVGRELRGQLAVGVVAATLVVLVRSTPSQGSFAFNDFSYSWLTESHTQLLCLVFFLAVLLLASELLSLHSPTPAGLVRIGALLVGCLAGCALAKEYATLPTLALGSFLFAVDRYVRRREVSWRALWLSLGAATALLLAVKIQLRSGGAGGFGVHPLGFVRSVPVTHALERALGTPAGVAVGTAVVPLGFVGLAADAGLVLFAVFCRKQLTDRHRWLLAVFASGAVPLFLLQQPGLSQLQMFMPTGIAGSVLAAEGLVAGARVLHGRIGRRAVTGVGMTGAGAALFAFGSLSLTRSPLPTSVGALRILVGTTCVAVALTALGRRPARLLRLGLIGGAATGAVAASDYIWVARLVQRKLHGEVVFTRAFPRVPTEAALAFEALGVVGLTLATAGLWRAFAPDAPARLRLSSVAAVTAAVAALAGGAIAVPLTWAPSLAIRVASGRPLYDTWDKGLTAGLYRGLTWVRQNTPVDTVLAVNNFSVEPHRDAKEFVYSAFSQRRVVLEGWDYTPETAKTGTFSLPLPHTPFPGRVVAECAAIDFADPRAIAFLRDQYGADYLFADLVHGAVSPLLGRRATLVFRDQDARIYRIPPASAGSTGEPAAFVATRTETVDCLGLRHAKSGRRVVPRS
jgi:hypothetical protein